MKENKPIERLAYYLKRAKNGGEPAPIVFLGAGASATGNIPLASGIVKDILKKYEDHPDIRYLEDKDKTYPKLMELLDPNERNELLKKYIDEAKINVTHIYLAQMLKNKFIDYVLTVNFDNLMLRALALYNIFPSTYDIAILKELTTSSFKKQSVIYLHGQHHGFWLLNTPAEMEKVEETVLRIFDTIKSERPWIFIGYSGSDPIFQHIKKLGRFDHSLYWLTYKDNDPSEEVMTFLNDPHTNGHLIKGHDSDSFLLKLTKELGLDQPAIIQKPFTTLKGMLDNIVDIKDEGQYKLVHERLDIVREQVDEAIERYEQDENSIEFIKKQLVDMLINEKFDEKELADYENQIGNREDEELNKLLSDLYYNWGTSLFESSELASETEKEDLYNESIEKYQKATQVNPDYAKAYNNWGNVLADLANLSKGKEAIDFFNQAIEKYEKATQVNPDYGEAYNNWGIALFHLAKLSEKEKAIDYFDRAIEKYQKAIQINPNAANAYNNWGTALVGLAKLIDGKEAIDYFKQAIKKYEKAIQINSNSAEAYNNWGSTLNDLAKLSEGEEAISYFNQAFEKYKEATQINPDQIEAYNNWGNVLTDFAKITGEEEAISYFNQAIEKYEKATQINPDIANAYYNWGSTLLSLAQLTSGADRSILLNKALDVSRRAYELGGDPYNLSCAYALLEETDMALTYLEESLQNKKITTGHVENDPDWDALRNDPGFQTLLDKYRGA